MIFRRLQRSLRASLLALLVLGLLITPVMHFMCEVHSIEHALLASVDRTHTVHFEGDRDDPGDQGQSGSKHTHGANWYEGGSPSFTPVVPVLAFTLIHPPRIALPPMEAFAIEPHASTSPFRPPIA
ncbi:hypothetical protein LYSHEL_06980 [Lysobacter helvus]|uniref:Uncharacterized protein n=2 Tax=Lysobacteraceae TaxID=32033 RepID=A0ABN6FQI6_9GAMM|nr:MULTISPECIES: hypothetical protein [Lysobacter]BCT91674.1 hypothetical protein LYSCAS_06980 [Lysobacter caseinilyticus]BCT94827.1 hypothetical protein LYSHEL_06980 [Lysobacter helvus]